MTATNVSDLTAAERRLLLCEVNEALRLECQDFFEHFKSLPQGGQADLEGHVDELVPIVRRSTATRIEPYLAQFLDDICTKCPHQQPSGHCPLRHEGNCIMFRCAGPIVAATRRALREIDIERGLAGRKEHP